MAFYTDIVSQLFFVLLFTILLVLYVSFNHYIYSCVLFVIVSFVWIKKKKSDPLKKTENPTVVIVGAGFSGLLMGINLKKQGIPFTILEKAPSLGGTWYYNTYPGSECDVPSYVYSFSFELPNWSKKYSGQAEILKYQNEIAKKYGLLEHILFNTNVVEAKYDPKGDWSIRCDDGKVIKANILISATGQLNQPLYPDIEGREHFKGPVFHSARWDYSVDLTNKRVAIIGNGASAIQAYCSINCTISDLSVHIPAHTKLHIELETIWTIFRFKWYNKQATEKLKNFMKKSVKDENLKKLIIPSYPIGCKRILISTEYLQVLERPNVQLITDPIWVIDESGITYGDKRIEVDVIIYCTGFHATEFLSPIKIEGLNGTLSDLWKDSPFAYLGMTVPGFPNFFILYGPGTNLGHNSILFMLECQANYITALLSHLQNNYNSLKSVEVKEEVITNYQRMRKEAMMKLPFVANCASWYKNKKGEVINNWVGTVLQFYWETRRPNLSEFIWK